MYLAGFRRKLRRPMVAATIAQQAATCAFCFKDHRCVLSAIQRVIHFDRSVIARDVRATIAFQPILIDESTVSTCYVKHLSCHDQDYFLPLKLLVVRRKSEISMCRLICGDDCGRLHASK
jgi:hypothetical protein